MVSLSHPIVELCKLLIALSVTAVLHQINGQDRAAGAAHPFAPCTAHPHTSEKRGDALQRWRRCDVFVC